MTRGWFCAAVLLATSACSATQEDAKGGGSVRITIPKNATKYALANGLDVILVEDHRSPFVSLHLRYHAGSKDDPDKREGLAHLYEHMTFGGSRHVARDEFLPSLDRLGARGYNGSTSRDHTDYYETVPASAFETALWLEGDRMRTAADVFDDKLLAREKDVVENERRLNVETVVLGQVPAIIAEAFYPPGHPYRHVPIGNTEGVRATTLGDLHAFHDKHYAPDNATLAVVGDFEPAHARGLIERYFGPAVPAKTSSPPRRFATIQAPSTRRIRVDANVSYGSVRVTWPLPAPGQPGYDESWAALVLGAWTIDTRANEKKLVHAVTSRFEGARLGTVGEVRAVLEPGASADAFVEVVNDVMVGLGRATSLRYLPDLKSDLLGGELFGQEWIADRAAHVQGFDAWYDDPNYGTSEMSRVSGLRSSAVISAYELFTPERALVTVVVPNPQAPLDGRREQ